MKGVARCISITLIFLSIVYFVTRLVSYKELLYYKERASKAYHAEALQAKYANFELLHILTIAHALSCFFISGFIYMILRGNTYTIDRRQYFSMIGLSGVLTTVYFLSLSYVVYKTTSTIPQTNSDDSALVNAFEAIIDLIASLSNNTFAFVFAIMINFVMLGAIYSLNLCSMYLIELAKVIEQRRTGGRNKKEVELNSFSVSRGLQL